MEEKLSGIVLSATAFGENDKILNIFTLEKGVISAGIKGVKKPTAKLRFAAEPFSFCEYVFSVKGERRTVVSASLIESFYPLRENIEKFFCGGAVLDYIRKFCREEIVSPELFLLATETLKTLCYTDKHAQSELAYFFIRALKISGYGLDESGCVECGKTPSGRIFFDAGSGGFLCENCFSGVGREINLSTYLALKNIAGGGEDKDFAVKALRLLDYFMRYRAEVVIKPLAELIKE
ncbi:MAG: DNA repair protein RecO [Clostridia bacterium]|nr:DNA repair protein RecO [Clostridia bacterium]